MQTSRVIHMVGAHAEGEVGDVITGGVAPPPGETLWAQSRWIAADGVLRDLVLNEPRGGVFRHVNLLVPPKDPAADAAFIVMEPEDTPPMSGSNAICVATVLLETGIVPMHEPETVLTLEAPGGLVRVRAACAGGRVGMVEIANQPAFVDRLDAVLEVEGLGTLSVDIAYGGDSFVIVDAAQLGLEIEAGAARQIAETGVRITAAANAQLGFRHPLNPDWAHISFCQITEPVRESASGLEGLSAVAIRPGKLDRSPCGTGCSARMAVLSARGQLADDQTFVGHSPIGSRFTCRIAGRTEVAGRPAVLPLIAGRAWLTGTRQVMVDPEDPWPRGYRLSDTWPRLD